MAAFLCAGPCSGSSQMNLLREGKGCENKEMPVFPQIWGLTMLNIVHILNIYSIRRWGK